MHEIDKVSSSSVAKSFATISEEDFTARPWDSLLGNGKACVPKIIKTNPSSGSLCRLEEEEVCEGPQAEDTAAKLTRSRSLVQGGGLFGPLQKQLRMSLRGVRSEPSSVKDVPSSRGENALSLFRYRQARFASRRVRKRVIFKHGDCNVVQWNVAKRRRRYLQDIFTTLVDAQWRWTLLVFALNFLLSWLAFALVWWLIILTHGDLNPEPKNSTEEWKPCVSGVTSFTGCFLFSVETQHTIGFGGRMTTEECPEAIFIMCLQSIVGVFIQAFMVGIVFAKLSRPKKRAQTLLFSRNAVICLRDGELCLMFRVGDMRKSHIVEAHIRAQVIRRKVGLIFAKLARAKKRNTTLLFSRNAVICLRDGEYFLLFRVGDIRKSHILEAHVRAQIIRKKVTREGEILPFYQQELKVGADGEEDRLMFIWPMTIVHKVNEKSPLYGLSASDMLRERFEIVVMLEGVIESTGMTTQARSSYLPSEVFWGHRFEPMVTFRKDTGEYEVDYTRFNNTYEVDTPLCSARQLDELRASVSTSQKLDRIIGLPKTFSNDTLDLSSVDSMSLDEQIEFKVPDSRVRENRMMVQNPHQVNVPRNYSQHHLHSDPSHSNLLYPPTDAQALALALQAHQNGNSHLPRVPSNLHTHSLLHPGAVTNGTANHSPQDVWGDNREVGAHRAKEKNLTNTNGNGNGVHHGTADASKGIPRNLSGLHFTIKNGILQPDEIQPKPNPLIVVESTNIFIPENTAEGVKTSPVSGGNGIVATTKINKEPTLPESHFESGETCSLKSCTINIEHSPNTNNNKTPAVSSVMNCDTLKIGKETRRGSISTGATSDAEMFANDIRRGSAPLIGGVPTRMTNEPRPPA